ncbi:MAG: tetratricopeptide repeat protein, partial [Thermoplasmata archaeon]|nr:tetratricopeptide repeat protein [Thermoplasmata archaeon]
MVEEVTPDEPEEEVGDEDISPEQPRGEEEESPEQVDDEEIVDSPPEPSYDDADEGLGITTEQKVFVEEELEELLKLPGVGMLKAKILYDAGFTDLRKLKQSTVVELMNIDGIGRKAAGEIKAALRDIDIGELRHAELRAEDVESEYKCPLCGTVVSEYESTCYECGTVFDSEMADTDDADRLALSYYDSKLLRDPNNKELWYARGATLMKMGEHEKALNSFDRALEIDPNFQTAWVSKAEVYNSMGNPIKAAECYTQVISKTGASFEGAEGEEGAKIEVTAEDIIEFEEELELGVEEPDTVDPSPPAEETVKAEPETTPEEEPEAEPAIDRPDEVVEEPEPLPEEGQDITEAVEEPVDQSIPEPVDEPAPLPEETIQPEEEAEPVEPVPTEPEVVPDDSAAPEPVTEVAGPVPEEQAEAVPEEQMEPVPEEQPEPEKPMEEPAEPVLEEQAEPVQEEQPEPVQEEQAVAVPEEQPEADILTDLRVDMKPVVRELEELPPDMSEKDLRSALSKRARHVKPLLIL